MIVNETEEDERKHLAATVARIREALEDVDTQIRAARSEILAAKTYVWSNRDQLDPAERAANVVDISLAVDHGEKAVVKRDKLAKSALSPYFGRVDFAGVGQAEAQPYYIGVHAFSAGAGHGNVVYDWRSPVASLFYDYNVGPARYDTVDGVVEGDIALKRQYRIQDGAMAYMLESAMRINDDILQRELSRTSDEKMRHIAATIQQEQNAIIRNEHAQTLIIQGVAGSGKTSVALHRVAFLLYRHKGKLTSANILILSPNKVFSDFIANVLPELGEERIAETGFEAIAAAELAGICEFQTFGEQVAELAASPDDALIERIRYKADAAFVQRLDAFVRHAAEHYFQASDISFPDVHVGEALIKAAYEASAGLPARQRAAKAAAAIASRTRTVHGDKLTAAAANRIKTAIRRMFKPPGLLALYKAFYAHVGRPELFKPRGKRWLECADAYPLAYLKIGLEGTKGYDGVKHLLVDEMQDYTAVQYALLARLFPCRKTILGDGSQSVNPYSSSDADRIKEIFPEAETVELLKSYRSSMEIIAFARLVDPKSRIVPIERHGERPRIVRAADEADERMRIGVLIAAFRASGHRSFGILCRTQEQAEKLHEALSERHGPVHRLDFASETFREGVVVTSVHMAKGLEFDQVAVPFANAANYRTEMERSLLYIACTRALHALALTFSGPPSPYLPEPELY